MRRARSTQSESPIPDRRLVRIGVGSSAFLPAPGTVRLSGSGGGPERDAARTSDATRWAYTRRAADHDEGARVVLGDGQFSYDSGQIGRRGVRCIGISHAERRTRTGEVM